MKEGAGIPADDRDSTKLVEFERSPMNRAPVIFIMNIPL